MTGALTIAAREVRERSFVFVTAAILAIMPFIVVIRPNRGSDPREAIIIIASIVSAGLTLGLAILLGASVVGRELADRRLSFYFSKPVAASAIWFGKIAGAVATIAISFAIAFLPAFFVAHNQWRSTLSYPLPLAVSALFVIAISLLLIAHGGSTVVRSRSPLVALDVALLATLGTISWWIIRPLLLNGAAELSTKLGFAIVFMIPAAVLAGGAWQLSRGRTEIRRSHRELSRFFWATMALTIALAGAFVAWVFAAGPRDIRIDGAAGNASADWLAMTGPAAHRADYRPAFLVDLKTGKSVRVPGSGSRNGNAQFTHRGDAFVTVWFDRDLDRFVVHVFRLKPSFAELPANVTIPTFGLAIVSDDLTRLATFEFGSRVLSVHDIRSDTIVGSVKIPVDGFAEIFFVSDDTVRIYSREYRGLRAEPKQKMRIFEFNARTHQIVETGVIVAEAKAMMARVNADGSRLIVSEIGGPAGQRTRIVDGRTGAEQSVSSEFAAFDGVPLSDGGVAFVMPTRRVNASLRIIDSQGRLIHTVPLPVGGVGRVRELIPGRKYLASISNDERRESGLGSTLCVVNVQRRIVERIERNFALHTQLRGYDPRMPAPNESGDFVVADANNVLWRWNALTGAKSRIF